MLIIKLTKEFKYSVDGYNVRTCSPGEPVQMPDKYAKIAEKAKYGKIVGEAPAVADESEEVADATETTGSDPLAVTGPQVIDLVGIGPVQTQSLADLGIDSLSKLINAMDNPDAVEAMIAINGIHADNLATYIDEAKALLSD